MAIYKRGDKNDQVKQIQAAINYIIFGLEIEGAPINHTGVTDTGERQGLKLDGIFGPRTEYCVLAVQKAYNRAYYEAKTPIPLEDLSLVAQPPTTTNSNSVVTPTSSSQLPTILNPPPPPATYQNDQVTQDQFSGAVLVYLDLAYWNRPEFPVEVDEDGIVGPDTSKILQIIPLPPKPPTIFKYTGRISDRTTSNRIEGAKVVLTSGEVSQQITTSPSGSFEITLTSSIDPSQTSITISAPTYFPKTINSIQQSNQVSEEEKVIYIYDIGKISLQPPAPIETIQVEKTLIIQQEENKQIEVAAKREMPWWSKLVAFFNKNKERLKKVFIAAILLLLSKFGPQFLQKIKNAPSAPTPPPDYCPNPDELLRIIRKRNQLVRQLNNMYKIISNLSKTLGVINTVITALKVGISLAIALPTPPFFPAGIVSSGISKLETALQKIGVGVNALTLGAALFGVFLKVALDLLNSLDLAIGECAENASIPVPFEAINSELNELSKDVLSSTLFSAVVPPSGIQGGATETSEQETGNAYKGFTFEIKLDPKSNSKYPKRFAQALNTSNVPVLKSDSSFASNPQVLIEQLKFIIDSQNLRGD